MTSDVASSASKPFEGPPGTSTASGWRGGVFFGVDAFSLDGFACVPAGSDRRGGRFSVAAAFSLEAFTGASVADPAGRGRSISDVDSSSSKALEGAPGTSTDTSGRGGIRSDADSS
ncbi:hypothetical protein [Corallococcus exercitus]|uniref:hypothetical protein n=1 Tax=Corallococcus exercitus TaxID=2316736 RepID=UPI001C114B01|nr:hypothetical protein [Corallococcus exercitus]